MRLLELRIPPPVVAAVLALLMWFAAQAMPSADFDFPGRASAAAVAFASGIAVGVAAFLQFRMAKTTVNPLTPHASSALVAHGVYRLTRNPMYLGMLLVLLGWGLIVSSFAALLIVPIFVVYMNRFQIGPEERALRARFGAAFDAYCAGVRRWL